MPHKKQVRRSSISCFLTKKHARSLSVLLIVQPLALTACQNPKEYGEHFEAAMPLESDLADPKYKASAQSKAEDLMPYTESDAKLGRDGARQFAYEVKTRSDAYCQKYKIDLTLQQTSTSLLLTSAISVFGAIGAVVGGVASQALNAASSATNGVNGNIQSSIYQKVTSVVANSIDLSRDKQWQQIANKLEKGKYKYKVEVFSDVQVYHNLCSLNSGFQVAEQETADAKKNADEKEKKNADENGRTDAQGQNAK